MNTDIFSLHEAEFWVLVGLVIFFGVLVFFGVPKMALKAIDDQRKSIENELEEAARIRKDAEALLESLKAKRLETERQANEMLAAAEAEALRFEAEARERLEESLKRREALAERKIAQAEAKAAADVKAAAVDAAAAIAEDALKARLAKKRTDPLVDQALAGMAEKLHS